MCIRDRSKTRWRGEYEPMPVWKPSYCDADISVASNDGFYNPKVKKYPLSMVSPVSIYRQHSSNDNNPMLREDCYRHAVWISGVDAQARGIKDGDLCRVYSDRGETLDVYKRQGCLQSADGFSGCPGCCAVGSYGECNPASAL